MGQVIAFPLPTAPYPELTVDLETAECVLLVAVRSWAASYRADDDPMPLLCRGLAIAGASDDAAASIDRLMTVVARTAFRPLDIRCPCCPSVSADEKQVLRAASLAQAGARDLADKVLRTTLLSAQGVDFALCSLEGLGAVFARAALFLSRRGVPDIDPDGADSRQARSPEAWSLLTLFH